MNRFLSKRPLNQTSLLGDRTFSGLQNAMNSLFDDFFDISDNSTFNRNLPKAIRDFQPRVDVRDNTKKIEITAELPGVEEKDVHLTVDKDYVRIKGEKRFEKEGDENDRHYVERSYGSFERLIPLSTEIDREKTEAQFKNGILRVTLPKVAGGTNEPRRITIKTGG